MNLRIIKDLQTRQTTVFSGHGGQPHAPVAIGHYGVQAWSQPGGLTPSIVPTYRRNRGYWVDRIAKRPKKEAPKELVVVEGED